jgi:hypothetical protein
MKALKKTSYLVPLVLGSLLSACGSSGVTGSPAASIQPQDNGAYDVPVETPTGYGAYPLTFRTVGTDAGTPSAALRTDSMLKVKVTVDPASQNVIPLSSGKYTNFTANYSCATVAVTLQVEQNGTYVDLATVVTNRLRANGTTGECAGSQASQTIDFSSYMTPGHGKVKIKAQAMTSNFNCLTYLQYPYNYPYTYGQVCSANPMQSIYQYHVVNGKLEVQVNGTDFVN